MRYAIQLKSKKWMCRIPVIEENGHLRRPRHNEQPTSHYCKVSDFANAGETSKWIDQVLRDIHEGRVLSKAGYAKEQQRGLTLAQWAEQYWELEEVRAHRARDRQQRWTWPMIVREGYIDPSLPLKDITAQHIRDMRDKIFKRGHMLNTVNVYDSIVRRMISYAVKLDILPFNPIAGKVPQPQDKTVRDKYLAPGDLMPKLLVRLPPHYWVPTSIMYWVGPRKMEAIGLRGCYDLGEQPYLVLRQTKTTPRRVPLPARLGEALRGIERDRPDYLRESPYMFYMPVDGRTSTTMKPMTAFAWHTWNRARLGAGLTDFRIHDLRHCAATNLRRCGVRTEVIMDIMGWSSIAMYRRYDKVQPEDHREAMRLVDGMMNQ